MLELAVARAIAENGRHIVITGASGWIGLATLDLLSRAIGDKLQERVSCFGPRDELLDLGAGRAIRQRPLAELPHMSADKIWLLHFAFKTKDDAEGMDESAYRAINLAIADTVSNALDRLDVEALFVASSGAVNRADDPAASAAMRLYGAMKRDDEVRFAAWAEASGRRAVIGRIFNITGPYINKHQAYAMASFILDALAGRPIAVQAPMPVVRSYVAIRELMSLVFALLASDGDRVIRFDSGGTPLELGDVAQIVAATIGDGRVDRAPITRSTTDHYAGDFVSYAALLDRHRIEAVALPAHIRETADYLASRVA